MMEMFQNDACQTTEKKKTNESHKKVFVGHVCSAKLENKRLGNRNNNYPAENTYWSEEEMHCVTLTNLHHKKFA